MIGVSVVLFVLGVVRVTFQKIILQSGRNNRLLFEAWISYYKTCHCVQVARTVRNTSMGV